MASDTRPLPPWLQYPGREPTWGGWRQGVSEAWFAERWLPFWRALGEQDRAAYLADFPPPDEDWSWYLREVWR